MVTHCEVDFRAGQSTETRGKAGCAAEDLLLVTRTLFGAAIAVCEASSFRFFLDFRGEDMLLPQTAVKAGQDATRKPITAAKNTSASPIIADSWGRNKGSISLPPTNYCWTPFKNSDNYGHLATVGNPLIQKLLPLFFKVAVESLG